MRLRTLLVLCSASMGLFGFEEKPWLGNTLEFYVDSAYSFYRFSSVANAKPGLHRSFNANLLTFDLGVPIDAFEGALELEFADTTKQSLGRRSVAVMFRMRWLDDIVGDPVSLTTGVSVRQTAYASLKDISCPSSSRWDFEAHAAVGKEWSSGADWMSRVYGIGALGQGVNGLPWTKAKLAYDLHQPGSHIWEFYGLGYWGFGSRHTVHIHHFHGWGPYNHSSVDLGLGYAFLFGEWGYLRFDLYQRVYSKVYPSYQTGVVAMYHFPFSF